MATFRCDLSEEYSKRLENDASEKRMSVQEYIRYKLFDVTTMFTVDEVLKRIENGDYENKEFCVPDVYTEEEWGEIDRGNAGVLGRNFYNYITEHPELGIHYVPNKTIKRRAVYTFQKEDN